MENGNTQQSASFLNPGFEDVYLFGFFIRWLRRRCIQLCKVALWAQRLLDVEVVLDSRGLAYPTTMML